jgi:hypothetical protein
MVILILFFLFSFFFFFKFKKIHSQNSAYHTAQYSVYFQETMNVDACLIAE